jgi:hypothetical protein
MLCKILSLHRLLVHRPPCYAKSSRCTACRCTDPPCYAHSPRCTVCRCTDPPAMHIPLAAPSAAAQTPLLSKFPSLPRPPPHTNRTACSTASTALHTAPYGRQTITCHDLATAAHHFAPVRQKLIYFLGGRTVDWRVRAPYGSQTSYCCPLFQHSNKMTWIAHLKFIYSF